MIPNGTTYILSICAAVLVSELLLMLLPNGNTRPFVELAVGIMLLFMLVSPFTKAGAVMPQIEFEKTAEALPKSYTDVILDVYNGSLERIDKNAR